jgi:hypothetical protein
MADEESGGWVKWSTKDKTETSANTPAAGQKGQGDGGPPSPPLQLSGKDSPQAQEGQDSTANPSPDGSPQPLAEGGKNGASKGGEAGAKKKQEWVVWEKEKYDEFLASYAASYERIQELEDALSSPQGLGEEEEHLREDDGAAGCDVVVVGEGEPDYD